MTTIVARAKDLEHLAVAYLAGRPMIELVTEDGHTVWIAEEDDVFVLSLRHRETRETIKVRVLPWAPVHEATEQIHRAAMVLLDNAPVAPTSPRLAFEFRHHLGDIHEIAGESYVVCRLDQKRHEVTLIERDFVPPQRTVSELLAALGVQQAADVTLTKPEKP